ncbi:MAG TPA: ATP-binding protein [Bacillota bacterium]|jgi:hypothetical protein|nr:ATP-binding protein [Bacillota bacterium]HOL08563.1 ATP-binding protein [Bacillota bacterium]HPO97823.1 ATP-binding protein [Bacillota bacterium]
MNNRITIIGGAYGSGKTEFAIAYALKQAQNGSKVGLVDLDIVNPYFRSRDVAMELENQALTVISTESGLEYSDLPALSPRIYSVLQDQSYRVVFDVGGDPAGARALGRFNQYFITEGYDFWVVINPYRPDTRNATEAIELIKSIQVTSRLKVTGIIANINLGPETTLELWQQGLGLIDEVKAGLDLPLVYHMVEQDFATLNQDFFSQYPVFPVTLKMLPPWRHESD